MGPWGPDMPVRPEVSVREYPAPPTDHCSNLCCTDSDTCRCECSWCDCRYAERMGS